MRMYNIDEEELILPPGIPESVIARVVEICNLRYEPREEPLAMVLIGKKENLEKAKKYLALITELKLFLRDLARLSKKHNIKSHIYTDDNEVRYLLEKIINDIANSEYIEIANELPDEYEVINILDKKIYVF